VAEPSPAKCDWFSKVAELIDQLDDDKWDSEDDLPVDFAVENDPPMQHENSEDIPRILNAAADDTFSAIVNSETVIDVPYGADISQLGLTEVLDAPVSVSPPIHSANSTRRAR